MSNDKVVDFTKFKKTKFKRDKKSKELAMIENSVDVAVHCTWIDEYDQVFTVTYDPANPLMTLTIDSKKVAIEKANQLIIDIASSDPLISTEYIRMFKKVYEQIRDN